MFMRIYQQWARDFQQYKHPHYPFFGLAEETGEFVGVAGKILRKRGTIAHITPEEREKLVKEAGDVLWQLCACCDELGLELADVANTNLFKLRDRAYRNVIVGEGDDR